MKVYRLEHRETHIGPYQYPYEEIMTNWVGFQLKHEKHPGPKKDSLLCKRIPKKLGYYWVGEMHFGFASLKQFRNWFFNDEVLKEFQGRGFVLNVYNVPKRYAGHTQAVFLSKYHDEGNIVETIQLDRFFSNKTLATPNKVV